jgi:uncharacterized membrane protein/thiol-disulfide isomerase/thioredoxin
MMKPTTQHSSKLQVLLISLLLIVAFLFPAAGQAQSSQVQVVLFYSPFCGHCQQLIAESLPPIAQAYNSNYVWSYYGTPPNEETGQLPELVAFEGDVLQILYVDASTQIGNELYLAAIERFQIAEGDQVVPIMVVGEQILIGGADIPNQLPGLVDTWLGEGGLSWPDIPGLADMVSNLVLFPDQAQPTATQAAEATSDITTPVPSNPDSQDPSAQEPTFEFDSSKLTVLERIQLDPVGNTLSIVVLIGMLFSVAGAFLRWRSNSSVSNRKLTWIIPALIAAGLLVAGYLSFVETTGSEAVCGPVGDCNTVQSSSYARLFGFLPIGVLGLLGYLGMLGAWIVARRASRSLENVAALALFGMALVGTVFSLYLTFLEPFVIGATCMWCLSSAVLITAIMLLSTDRARQAYIKLQKR